MSEHTPGPWALETTYDDNCDTDRWGVYDDTGALIAETWKGQNCNTEEMLTDDQEYANARLIAAAPELLEALQHLLEWADPKLRARQYWTNGDVTWLTDKARAAITKATGNPPCT